MEAGWPHLSVPLSLCTATIPREHRSRAQLSTCNGAKDDGGFWVSPRPAIAVWTEAGLTRQSGHEQWGPEPGLGVAQPF